MITRLYRLSKPILFRLSAEQAHHISLKLFGLIYRIPFLWKMVVRSFKVDHPSLKRNCAGLEFKNPVGLAAGFDKDGQYMHLMAGLGFGFLELGTVTPRPQLGNPKPRLFRIPRDHALINRMGFNNEGVHALVDRLKSFNKPEDLIIGGNIGKNKDTPNEQAVEDYLYCFEALHDYVDYFVVNVSSPNTPGLRELQNKESLKTILSRLIESNLQKETQRPIFLKISPDENEAVLQDILDLADELNIAGLVCSNTSVSRKGLHLSKDKLIDIGKGGLSGAPIFDKSSDILRKIVRHSNATQTQIGVGGIDSPLKAVQKLEIGADLIQVYSGMIFYGPALVRDILRAITKNTN
jgi:dihydroorotate dehydrogenase